MRIAVVLSAVTLVSAGCILPTEHCSEWTEVMCHAQGSVQVAAPTLLFSPNVPATGGATCEAGDGTCATHATVYFRSISRAGVIDSLSMNFDVEPDAGPGTFNLVAAPPGVHVLPVLYTTSHPDGENLIVRAGELAVTRSDRQRFTGTFAMELDSTDGLHHLSLTDGAFDVGDCTITPRRYCSD